MNREIIEAVKQEVIAEANKMRELNEVIPVTGERMDLKLKDRSINIVFYKTEQKNRPLILAFHGGGFLFGGNAMNDLMWSTVRDVLNANIVSVEYRKSPEYKWREALEDAYDSACYMYEHADTFEFDKDQISVMGGSAGANIAATLCLYAKQQGKLNFKNQILMYPFLDLYTDPDSKGKGSLEGPIMYVFNELHVEPEELKNPLVSPVFATEQECAGLPDAILVMADNDNLKAEGYTYAELLKRAGVKISVTECEKMPHGFLESGFEDICEGGMDFLSEEVIKMIKSGEVAKASQEALEFVKEHFSM